jgi:hypothetical protein
MFLRFALTGIIHGNDREMMRMYDRRGKVAGASRPLIHERFESVVRLQVLVEKTMFQRR